jgi:hypothetical protein
MRKRANKDNNKIKNKKELLYKQESRDILKIGAWLYKQKFFKDR